ncbi:MAG TPA: multicopper oxidase domain-containing protein [Gemmatimonadota bacterium]|nr:multicopper oxidase domain-containing protein [Gemmatimonadota bacterium]
MTLRSTLPLALALAAMAAGLVALAAADRSPTLERVDCGRVVTPTQPAHRAEIAPASDARVREFRIPITHETIEIAPGKTYDGWTFGGTVPGPVVRARQGDLVRITLVNESPMGHSIDFHAARIPMNEAFTTIAPGAEMTFEFEARDPGAFMVHCGTPPVLLHIMQGMYMTMVVDPRDGWGTEVDAEFVLVQSEFYPAGGENGAPAVPDYDAARAKDATYVVFNGKAGQYRDAPLEVEEGDRVRFFVVNAGPSLRSDFHIVGAVFDRVYPGGDPKNFLEGVQTYAIPAGGGAVFETVFEEGASGAGVYAFVTHAFADAEKGAVGLIRVGSAEVLAGMGH